MLVCWCEVSWSSQWLRCVEQMTSYWNLSIGLVDSKHTATKFTCVELWKTELIIILKITNCTSVSDLNIYLYEVCCEKKTNFNVKNKPNGIKWNQRREIITTHPMAATSREISFVNLLTDDTTHPKPKELFKEMKQSPRKLIKMAKLWSWTKLTTFGHAMNNSTMNNSTTQLWYHHNLC